MADRRIFIMTYSMQATNQKEKKIIERKIRYDSTIVETDCVLLEVKDQKITLFHKIEESFTMKGNSYELTIPKGSYTLAYYWKDRPYNLYIWRDKNGAYLGSYFNIVKNTHFTDAMLSFEDLIIDLLVFPNGDYFILDEDELPMPFHQFENGSVQQSLQDLIHSLPIFTSQTLPLNREKYSHEELFHLYQAN